MIDFDSLTVSHGTSASVGVPVQGVPGGERGVLPGPASPEAGEFGRPASPEALSPRVEPEREGWEPEPYREPEPEPSSPDAVGLLEVGGAVLAAFLARRKRKPVPPGRARSPRAVASEPNTSAPPGLVPVLLDCGHRVGVDPRWRGHVLWCRTCGETARIVPED